MVCTWFKEKFHKSSFHFFIGSNNIFLLAKKNIARPLMFLKIFCNLISFVDTVLIRDGTSFHVVVATFKIRKSSSLLVAPFSSLLLLFLLCFFLYHLYSFFFVKILIFFSCLSYSNTYLLTM